jgi:endonuclease/exonuclease/phosphatase family metal-dependent hydrolase
LGELIARDEGLDLVALQECWGPAVDSLQKHLQDRFYIPSFYRSFSLPGVRNWLNTLWFYAQGNGGLSCAFNKKTGYVVRSFRHSFRNSNTKSAKGCHAHLMLMDCGAGFSSEEGNGSTVPPKTAGRNQILLCTTHFDPTNKNGVIEKQVDEVMEFLRQVVAEVGPEDFGIILTGDLNVGSTSSKTNPILNGFFKGTNCRDLYGEYISRSWMSGKREVTYGGNHFALWEPQSIDYIFVWDQIDGRDFPKISVQNVEIIKQPKGEELSDHWGMKMKLKM